MYLRHEARGKGIGKLIIQKVMDEVKKLGYNALRLDTLPSMKAAIGLYERFGFQEIKPYRFNPIEGSKFYEIKLS